MRFRKGKTGAARNLFDGIGEVASLCFGCPETACHPLRSLAHNSIPLVYTV